MRIFASSSVDSSPSSFGSTSPSLFSDCFFDSPDLPPDLLIGDERLAGGGVFAGFLVSECFSVLILSILSAKELVLLIFGLKFFSVGSELVFSSSVEIDPCDAVL